MRKPALKHFLQEPWIFFFSQIVHNNVPLGSGAKELELGGAECYVAVEDQPVIFDDEPRNPSELARHPEREAILVSAGKEIDQLIEQEIGVEVTQAEVKQVTDKGIRILQCKMVYKRKYIIGEDGKERFLKWKSRLAVVGSSEREGWETVYSTFSPTVAFSAVRLLISLTVDPKFTVGLEEAALADVHDGVTNFGSGNVVKCAIAVNVNGLARGTTSHRRAVTWGTVKLRIVVARGTAGHRSACHRGVAPCCGKGKFDTQVL